MKRFLSVLTTLFVALALFAQDRTQVYFVGDATPHGWDNREGYAVPMIGENGVFTWNGYLKEGDFKFISRLGDYDPGFKATAENQPIAAGNTYDIVYEDQGGNDYKFMVTEAGYYKLDLNMDEMTLSVKTGINYPIPSSLKIIGSATGSDEGIELTPFQRVENKFYYPGDLAIGEVKFSYTDGDNTYYLVPGLTKEINGSTSFMYTDDSEAKGWNVIEEYKNFYIVIDVSVNQLTGSVFDKELYLLGNATTVGWNDLEAIPFERDANDPFVFTLTTELMIRGEADDDRQLKMLFQQAWGDGLYAVVPGTPIQEADYVSTNGDGDNKWYVSDGMEGSYTIRVNLRDESISFTRAAFLVGGASVRGWDADNPIPFEADPANPDVLTLTTFLRDNTDRQGESDFLFVEPNMFKLLGQRGWENVSWHPIVDGQDILSADNFNNHTYTDYKWTVSIDGVYHITLNFADYTISAELVSQNTGTATEVKIEGVWNDDLFNRLNTTEVTSIDLTAAIDEPSVKPVTANPNCLIFVADNSTMSGINVIKNGTGEVELLDGYNFKNPVNSFTATSIIYNRDISEMDHTDGWASIALPFESHIPDGYLVEEFDRVEGESLIFRKLGVQETLKANMPYIVKVPDTDELSFNADNAEVATTTVGITKEVFKSTFELIPAGEATGYYILKTDGSAFIEATVEHHIPAFRSYIADNGTLPKSMSVVHDGEATQITTPQSEEMLTILTGKNGMEIISPVACILDIYHLDGRLCRSVSVQEGSNRVSGLASGIYFINNQKCLVK